jgi:hypothetical protein
MMAKMTRIALTSCAAAQHFMALFQSKTVLVASSLEPSPATIRVVHNFNYPIAISHAFRKFPTEDATPHLENR